jgi:hypothetical protein
MRINTEESIKLGEMLHERFGSWEAVRRAAELKDGVYVVPADDHPQSPERDRRQAG